MAWCLTSSSSWLILALRSRNPSGPRQSRVGYPAGVFYSVGAEVMVVVCAVLQLPIDGERTPQVFLPGSVRRGHEAQLPFAAL